LKLMLFDSWFQKESLVSILTFYYFMEPLIQSWNKLFGVLKLSVLPIWNP
jgi:hypothetical protein